MYKIYRNEQINKTLIKFMGDELLCEHCSDPNLVRFTESLDALVPVVEKLKDNYSFNLKLGNQHYEPLVTWSYYDGTWRDQKGYVIDKSPSRALALACYRVVIDMPHMAEQRGER